MDTFTNLHFLPRYSHFRCCHIFHIESRWSRLSQNGLINLDLLHTILKGKRRQKSLGRRMESVWTCCSGYEARTRVACNGCFMGIFSEDPCVFGATIARPTTPFVQYEGAAQLVSEPHDFTSFDAFPQPVSQISVF